MTPSCRHGQHPHFYRGISTILLPAGVCGFGSSLGGESVFTEAPSGRGWEVDTSLVGSRATEIKEEARAVQVHMTLPQEFLEVMLARTFCFCFLFHHPIVIVHRSFIIVPVNPSPFSPIIPLLSPLVTVSLFSISMSLAMLCLLVHFAD